MVRAARVWCDRGDAAMGKRGTEGGATARGWGG
jgi:hypothetical protein